MGNIIEKVKTAAPWVVAAIFFLCAWVAFPSFGCLLFLIGLAVSLPLAPVRDFFTGKGLRGAPKVALIVALLIAGSLATPDELLERGETDALESATATPESADYHKGNLPPR